MDCNEQVFFQGRGHTAPVSIETTRGEPLDVSENATPFCPYPLIFVPSLSGINIQK